MSFGLSMYHCTVSSINSHAEAVAFYNSCKVKRGHDHGDERPIRGKERSSMSVRISANGAVHFKYHHTDVVSWYPDNSFKIGVYTSNSTCTFADCFTPRRTHMTKTGTVLMHGDLIYPLLGSLTVHADGRVIQERQDTCFAIGRTDRRKGKEALARTRYAEYRTWYNVMWPMVKGTVVYLKPTWQVEREAFDMLADEAQWHDLMMSVIGNPNTLRELIYSEADDVFYTEYADTLSRDTSWHTLIKWKVTTR
jgi:hypothetical protein